MVILFIFVHLLCDQILHFCFKEIQEDDGGNGFQFLYDKVFGEINWFTHCRQKLNW